MCVGVCVRAVAAGNEGEVGVFVLRVVACGILDGGGQLELSGVICLRNFAAVKGFRQELRIDDLNFLPMGKW